MRLEAGGVVEFNVRAQFRVTVGPTPLLQRLNQSATHAGSSQVGCDPPTLAISNRHRLTTFGPRAQRQGSKPSQATIRTLRPWAEGCKSMPVPYIEGWWVAPDLRRT